MYVEINTRLLKGIFKVKEITGSIVTVINEGNGYDVYLKAGEVVRFCNEDGTNLIKQF